MIDLDDRRICDDGTVILSSRAAMEALYRGFDLGNAWLEACEDVTMHNDSNRMLDLGMTQLKATDGPRYANARWYETWNTPDPYRQVNVLDHCIDKCDTDDERIRVCEEYKLFDERGMIPVLQHLIYMVDKLRENKITWGVGRGSSVSSFILYLIGINRINPLEFDLDINEFLK